MGGVTGDMAVDPLAGWVAGPKRRASGKKRARQTRATSVEEDEESSAVGSPATSPRRDSSGSEHLSFDNPPVEDHLAVHPVIHQDTGVPIPKEFKVAI
ncbi:hypothetical protein PTT_19440 [Pyrenophora teres f. teres 0-1]|uniref:Uncharacterized protein n=1 Tax=Pyrenophora teres f. teres (strain 0-1) TaxID=861557 RepID=E3S8V5_PYRTT|nr:hypothetical protein PTT_19440 [Pyrenophora teres f. teres 0-1]